MLVASCHWQHTISAAAALIGETPPNISRCPVDLQLLMCVNNLPKVPGRLVCAGRQPAHVCGRVEPRPVAV